MKRTLFTAESLTGEGTNSGSDTIEGLANTLTRAELTCAYQSSELDVEEIIQDLAVQATSDLTHVKSQLEDKEAITGKSFESLQYQVTSASKLLNRGLTIEAVNQETFLENKDAHISELEATVEGFISSITSRVRRLGKALSGSVGNFLVTLFTRQTALGKLADKLQTKMQGHQGGDVEGMTIKNINVAKWFLSADDAIEKLKSFNGLRAAMPGVQEQLKAVPAKVEEKEVDFDGMYKIFAGGLDSLAKAPGVKVASHKSKDADTSWIEIPGPEGRSAAFAVARLAAAVVIGTSATFFMASLIPLSVGVTIATASLLATDIAVGYGAYKALTWAGTTRVPVLSWDQINSVLEEVSGMAATELSLKGMTRALDEIQKVAKSLTDAAPRSKKVVGQLVSLVNSYTSAFRAIYSRSVSCARAGVNYASRSLKKHLNADNATGEGVTEQVELYKDADLITKTFESIDSVLHPVEEPAVV